MQKRLQRPPDKAMIGGVCSGIAEYFGVDPTWIRLLAVLLIFASGFGLVAYVVAWIVIPRGPLGAPADNTQLPTETAALARESQPSRGVGFIPGVILILLGMVFLFDELFWWFDWDYVWPLLLVGAGVLMIFHSLKPSQARNHETVRDIAEAPNGGR